MSLFSRKKRNEQVQIAPPLSSRVEVELDKTASRQAAEKAKLANQHLNEILVNNGFTLKIYLATGGKPKRKRRR